MLGVSKKSHEPTTYYALAFCTHVVAFVILVIGTFTPNWSQVTEQGKSLIPIVYDKGLIVWCTVNQSCYGITDFSQLSEIFFADFVLGIVAVVFGFFALQMFCAGLFIRSCKETNLGIPIAVVSICEGALLMLVLVLFEISVSLDTLSGENIHRKDTFGFSRGLIVGAIVLYFIASFFSIGEYMRRFGGPSHPQKAYEETKQKSRHRRSNRDDHKERGRRPPPPYQ
uniref:MARVEL domain-containing protein n=1 Tax=Arion vulgaris TaxID=1028688 RepID=A0A0B7A6A4_9EUPU